MKKFLLSLLCTITLCGGEVTPGSLLYYRANVDSTRGEAGIYREIFARLGIDASYFADIGAGRTMYFSPTTYLLETAWTGLLIDKNEEHYLKIKNFYADDPLAICVHETVVGSSGSSVGKTLEEIMAEQNFPTTIDFLHIGTDGGELELFEAITLKPKVISIEGGYNWHSTFQTRIPYAESLQQVGQPLYVTYQSLVANGYYPVCFTGCLIAVRNDPYFRLFDEVKNDTTTLWMDAWNILTNGGKEYVQKFRNGNAIVQKYDPGTLP